MYYYPKHFITKELVDSKTYGIYGESALTILFDARILYSIDRIREFYNSPIIINDWHLGGKLEYRGFRPFDCKIGAKYSQHKFGRALDFTLKNHSADEVRKDLKKYEKLDCFKFINRIEDDVDWIHIDCGNYEKNNGIIFFKP